MGNEIGNLRHFVDANIAQFALLGIQVGRPSLSSVCPQHPTPANWVVGAIMHRGGRT